MLADVVVIDENAVVVNVAKMAGVDMVSTTSSFTGSDLEQAERNSVAENNAWKAYT